MSFDGYVPPWAYCDDCSEGHLCPFHQREEEKEAAFYKGWIVGIITAALPLGMAIASLLLWGT